MNRNKNTYIILYSVVLVVIVAVALTFTAMKLQPIQQVNVEVEKKGDILNSVGLISDAAAVEDKQAYIDAQYKKYIVDSYLVNTAGERVEGDAFAVLNNLKAEYDRPEGEKALPVFVSRADDGTEHYILPIWGAGLWGPVWGYIALDQDWDTIYGVVFDHKSETPGLGAEIATPYFENQFKGKTIFEDGKLVGIAVVKGPGSSAGNEHAVDAISGGTITSRAVERMVISCLKDYEKYLLAQRDKSERGGGGAKNGPAAAADTTSTPVPAADTTATITK